MCISVEEVASLIIMLGNSPYQVYQDSRVYIYGWYEKPMYCISPEQKAFHSLNSRKILFSLSPYISPSKFANLLFVCSGGTGKKGKSRRINPSFIWWLQTKEGSFSVHESEYFFGFCPWWKVEEGFFFQW